MKNKALGRHQTRGLMWSDPRLSSDGAVALGPTTRLPELQFPESPWLHQFTFIYRRKTIFIFVESLVQYI